MQTEHSDPEAPDQLAKTSKNLLCTRLLVAPIKDKVHPTRQRPHGIAGGAAQRTDG